MAGTPRQDYSVSNFSATDDNGSGSSIPSGSCPVYLNSTEWFFCSEYIDLSQIPAVHKIIIFMYAVVMAIGIGGNSMVIAIVVRHRHMRTPTNFYIVSLAFSDLLLTAFALPLKLVELSADVEKSIHNPTVCSVLGFLIPMFVFTSVWTLTAISIDRYLVIVHPLRSRNFNTKSRAIRVISVVWLVPFLVFAPYYLPQNVFAYYAYSDYGVIRRELCTEKFHDISPEFAMGYGWLLLLVLYFIPTLVLCFTCGSIALRLLGVTDQQSIIKSSLRKEEAGRRKVAKMVLIVVFAFVICWTPFFLAQIIGNYSTVLRASNYFFILLLIHLFSFSNSLLNPIIYFLMSQAFRRGFASILACIFPCFKVMLLQERRIITGVSTSEVGENSRADFGASRKRGHEGRSMSWRETTQYSAISESPEEIDMKKISSNKIHDKKYNEKSLKKIDEVVDGEPDAQPRIEDEVEYLMSNNLNDKKSDPENCIKNTENTYNNCNYSDVDLNSDTGNLNVNDESIKLCHSKCDANANSASPPEVIVNSYS